MDEFPLLWNVQYEVRIKKVDYYFKLVFDTLCWERKLRYNLVSLFLSSFRSLPNQSYSSSSGDTDDLPMIGRRNFFASFNSYDLYEAKYDNPDRTFLKACFFPRIQNTSTRGSNTTRQNRWNSMNDHEMIIILLAAFRKQFRIIWIDDNNIIVIIETNSHDMQQRVKRCPYPKKEFHWIGFT